MTMLGRERSILGATIAVVFLAPLLIGGALPWAQVALSLACLAILVATFYSIPEARRLKLSPLSGMLLLAAAVTAWQLLPLPRFLVQLLSPRALALRLDAQSAAPYFLPLTLDVPATALELVKALAVAGLFVAVAAVAHRRRRAFPLLWGVAFAGGLVALVAIIERSLGTEAILGIYRPLWCHDAPCRSFVGTFVNENHAAELFGLSLCVSIGLAAHGGRWRGMAFIVVLLSAVGMGLTTSRGGVIAFGLATFVLLALIFSRVFGRLAGVLLTVVILAMGITVVVMLTEGASTRFEQLDLRYLVSNQKAQVWHDSLGLVRDFAWTGVGRGAFLAPFQRYRSVDDGATITHPENLLLQLGSEWGLPLALAVLAVGVITAWRHRQRLRKLGPVEWGAALGLGGVLLQNFVDFGLELAGVALPVAVTLGALVGRACAKESVHRRRVGSLALYLFGAAWLAAIGLAAFSVPHLLREDDARLQAMLREGAPLAVVDGAARRAIRRHPADYHIELLDAMAHVKARDAAALHHINRVLRLRPKDIDAHRLAGLTLARLRRPEQAALEYRTAFEGGMPLSSSYFVEVASLLGERAVEAMPPRPEPLMALAQALANDRPTLAEAACVRAQASAPEDERPSRLGLELALAAGVRERTLRAAAALERAARNAPAYLAAAHGFHVGGDAPSEERVLLAAIKAYPADAGVGLALAQLYYDAGDLVRARRAIARLLRATADLEARRRAEELLAVVETRAGDEAEAVMARARARMYRDTLRAQQPAAP